MLTMSLIDSGLTFGRLIITSFLGGKTPTISCGGAAGPPLPTNPRAPQGVGVRVRVGVKDMVGVGLGLGRRAG